MVEKLGVIAGIVPSNSPKPILYDFFIKTREGCLEIEANDLEVAGLIRIERVEVMEEGSLALPANRLLSILREIPASTTGITLEGVPEMQGAGLKANGYEFKLFGNDPDEFPRIIELETRKPLEVIRETFSQSLRRVAVATCRDPSRYQLGGVFFEIRDKKLTFTATDGKRLTNDFFKVDCEDDVAAIVPNRAVDAILKILSSSSMGGEEKFTLGFTDTDVVVKTEMSQLNAKLIEGTFPNYRNALKQNVQVKVKALKSDLLSASKSAQLMTDDLTSTVIFRFDSEGLTIFSQAKDIGETRIHIKAEVENGPLEIRFNPSYVIDAIRCVDEDEVRIEFESGERPGIIRGGMHYRHMIMPLVLENK